MATKWLLNKFTISVGPETDSPEAVIIEPT